MIDAVSWYDRFERSDDTYSDRWGGCARGKPSQKFTALAHVTHDAVQGAHYGRPRQPHAEESLAWLRKRIQGKTLYCQLLRKDQYGRVVSDSVATRDCVHALCKVGIPLVPRPYLPLFFSKHFGSSLALEMLRAGMATTYTESGAEYGPWGREQFLRVEEEAR